MKPHFRSAHLALSFFLSLGLSPIAWAQPADTLVAAPHIQLSTEEIVTHLIQRNLELALALYERLQRTFANLHWAGQPPRASDEWDRATAKHAVTA